MYTIPNRPDKSIILLGFLVAVDDTRGMNSRQTYQSCAVVAVLEPPVEDFIICYNLIGHVSQEINWLHDQHYTEQPSARVRGDTA